MRVRIVNATEGIVEGISLGHLKTGLVYDLPPSVARFLIAKRCAKEPLITESPLVVQLDDANAYESLTRGISVVLPRPQASDRALQRRHSRRTR